MKVRNVIFLFAIVTSISATEYDEFELRLHRKHHPRHKPGRLASQQYQRPLQRNEFRNRQSVELGSSHEIKNSRPLKPPIITIRRKPIFPKPRPKPIITNPPNRPPPQPPHWLKPKPIWRPYTRRPKKPKPTKPDRTNKPTTIKTIEPTKTTGKTKTPTTHKTTKASTTQKTTTSKSTTTQKTNTTSSTTTKKSTTESDSSSEEWTFTFPTQTETESTTASKKTTTARATTTTSRATTTNDGIPSSEEETSSSEDTVEHTSNERSSDENSSDGETDSGWNSKELALYEEYRDDSSKTTVTMTAPPTDPPEYLDPPDPDKVLDFINSIMSNLTCFYDYIFNHVNRCTKIVNQFQFCPKDPDGVREYYTEICKDYLDAANMLIKVCNLHLGVHCIGNGVVALAKVTIINFKIVGAYMWHNLSKMDICMREQAVNMYCDGYKAMGDLAICTIITVVDFIT